MTRQDAALQTPGRPDPRQVPHQQSQAGRSHLFQVHRPDDGHVFRLKYFNWMARWFEEHL